MTPFDEQPYLGSNQQVFDAGLKFLCVNDEECAYAHKHLEYSNVRLAADAKKFIIGPKELGATPDDNRMLALARDRGAFPYSTILKDVVIHQQESCNPGTKCYMVAEYWNVYSVSYRFTGPLSEAMYDTLRNLRQTGIIDFWSRIPTEIGTRRQRAIEITESEDNAYFESGMAYMNAMLLSLVHLFAGTALLTILCLTAEILYPRLIARWNRFRERRRFLRAIWPLGNI